MVKYNLSPSRDVLNSAGPRHPHRRRLILRSICSMWIQEVWYMKLQLEWKKETVPINVVMETPGSEPVLLQLLGLHCFSWNILNWLVNYIFFKDKEDMQSDICTWKLNLAPKQHTNICTFDIPVSTDWRYSDQSSPSVVPLFICFFLHLFTLSIFLHLPAAAAAFAHRQPELVSTPPAV